MKEAYEYGSGRRGAIDPLPRGKTRITIRLDNDVLDWFRDRVEAAGGGNYQTLINQALRSYIEQQRQPLDTTLETMLETMFRRVLREEWATYE